MKDFVIFFC